MKEESTPLADIMINIGISEGKAEGRVEGRAEERKAIDNQMDEALKADPTISLAEFKKQFMKNQRDD